MDVFDIAIIGTGPAGVSAAITAKVRNKSVLLIGQTKVSEKTQKAHKVLNYPGLPDVTGAELAKAFSDHLDSMDVPVTQDRITAVYAMGDTFALQGASGEMYTSRTVILATGVVAIRQLEGEEALLGSGVSYCATCDAPLYRGKTVAVAAYSPKEEAEARFLSEVCEKVIYFPVYKEEPALTAANAEIVREKPKAVSRDPASRRMRIVTDGGEYEADGVFILRDSVAPAQLVPGLETDGAAVKCDRQMRTNIPGCFVCGDLAGKPYQYVKSAGEGNAAALSAVEYLNG